MPSRSPARNSRRKNQISSLGVLFLSLAIVVAALILNTRKDSDVQAATAPNITVSQYDMVIVPVPAAAVAAGTRVREIKFKNLPYPKHQLPAGAITDISAVADSVAIAPLPANVPLFHENLNREGHVSNPVLENIPAGMRAMTVRVDATSSVEGWAGSGSYVDLLLVEKDRTTVVAEMVKILSAERSVSPVEGSAAPSVPSTATLLVTQEQCLAINTAVPLGKIAFALRSSGDKERWLSTQYTSESLKGGALIKDVGSVITGYLSSQADGEKRSFALTDGKWIETEVVPEGFLVNKSPRVAND